MADIFLPIAHMDVNLLTPSFLGFTSGIFAGLFGVSASFLVTPTLILLGIPPSIAVASQSNQLVAIATSEALRSVRRRSVDFTMLSILLIGNFLGAFAGFELYKFLEPRFNYESLVMYSYMVLLVGISLWATQDALAFFTRITHRRTTLHGLPLKVKFRTSNLYISALPLLALGFVAGACSYMLGIGGAFIVVPFCTAVLLIPRRIARSIGIFQILFASIFATLAHAAASVTGDAVLVVLLLTGGLPGLSIGRDLSKRMSEFSKSVAFAISTLLFTLSFLAWFTVVANQPVVTLVIR